MTFNLSLIDDPHGVEHSFPAASLVEDLDLSHPDSEGGAYFTLEAWCKGSPSPCFVLRQKYLPGPTSGFLPSYLFIPQTNTLFVGAGSRRSCYDLSVPARKWTEFPVGGGFRTWNRHGDLVIHYGDNEIIGFDLSGHTLWGAYVKQDWSYEVVGEQILLTEPNGQVGLCEDYKQRLFDFSQGPLVAEWVNCKLPAIPVIPEFQETNRGSKL